jgi:hypothetical protein
MALGKLPNQKLRPFFKRLGPEFDNFARRGTMLIHQPVTMLMGGFWLDPSVGSPDLRWISTFVCPLYVPTDMVWLNWGDRIPGPGPENRANSRLPVFGPDEELEETFRVMINEGLATVLPALELDGFYEYLLSWNYCGKQLKSISYEAMGYTAALLGREEEVRDHLFNSEMSLTLGISTVARPNGLFPEEEQRLARVRRMRGLLKEEGLETMVKQLVEWRTLALQQFDVGDIAQPNE